jgi:hypothetical protein
MAYSAEKWAELSHPEIVPGYLISTYGRISVKSNLFNYPAMDPPYHSTNGYDYYPFIIKKNESSYVPMLYPVDELVALTFIQISSKFLGVPIKITHINGNTRDNNFENLKWEEDIEEWKEPTCPIITKSGRIIDVAKGLYKVSSHGRFFSNITKKEMNPWLDAGYYKISLIYSDGTKLVGDRNSKLHRLMALTFNLPGHSDERQVINHINGNRSDFNFKNLEWVTNHENAQHAYDVKLGVNPAGEEHPRAKFTNHQRECVYEIIRTLDDVQPSHLTGLIRRRLPMISRDDVKYAKKLLRRMGYDFPDLSDKWMSPQKFTEEEWLELESKVDEIFDKYGIYQMEVYNNGNKESVQG